MAAEELTIQRLGEKFWSSRLWGCKGESGRGSGKVFFWGEHVVEGKRQIVLDAHRDV
jgi:hypothetical protein